MQIRTRTTRYTRKSAICRRRIEVPSVDWFVVRPFRLHAAKAGRLHNVPYSRKMGNLVEERFLPLFLECGDSSPFLRNGLECRAMLPQEHNDWVARP